MGVCVHDADEHGEWARDSYGSAREPTGVGALSGSALSDRKFVGRGEQSSGHVSYSASRILAL